MQDPLSFLSKGQTDLGEFGVMGFFALSGYLITSSFDRTKNIPEFLTHRFFRIFPGFWVCLLFTAFVIAPVIFCLNRPAAAFPITGQGSALQFVRHNFFLKVDQWNIRDVLIYANYQGSLNGSLWSLYPEMQCYFFTMIAGFSGLFNKNKFLYLIVAVTIFTYFTVILNFSKNFGPTVLSLSPALKLYASYVAGTLVYVFRDQLLFEKRSVVFLVLYGLILVKFGGYHLFSPLLVALVLLNVFQLFEFKLKYDISYGIYIYSFPVQQLLSQIFHNKLNMVVFIFLSLLISGVLGFFSYVFVERTFIKLRVKTDKLFKKT